MNCFLNSHFYFSSLFHRLAFIECKNEFFVFILLGIHLNPIDIASVVSSIVFCQLIVIIFFFIFFECMCLSNYKYKYLKKRYTIFHECICVANTRIIFEHLNGFDVRHELKTITAIAAICWLYFGFNCSAWPYEQNRYNHNNIPSMCVPLLFYFFHIYIRFNWIKKRRKGDEERFLSLISIWRFCACSSHIAGRC